MLGKTVASLQSEETEPEGKNTEIHSNSPPRVIFSHCQHLADYVKLFMEEGEELTLGEDWPAPLITDVSYLPRCLPQSILQLTLNSSFWSYSIHHLIFRLYRRFALQVK